MGVELPAGAPVVPPNGSHVQESGSKDIPASPPKDVVETAPTPVTAAKTVVTVVKTNDAPILTGDDKGTMRGTSIILFGLYFVALAFVLIQALTAVWPVAGASGKVPLLFGLFQADLTPDVRLILVVAIAAALGSYVSAANSFVAYVGNNQLCWSWAWWYLLLPFSSSMTAMIFYFAVRGGIVSSSAPADSGSVYVVAALSGLVGMFSRETIDALHGLFSKILGVPPPTTALADPLRPADRTIVEVSGKL